MKTFKTVVLIIAVFCCFSNVFADSPLTSTPFYEAYLDVSIVKRAKESGVLDREMAEYLNNPVNSIDKRAALVNALGWDTQNKDNAEKFAGLVFGKTLRDVKLEEMNADQQIMTGYLMAMDNYFEVERALPYLKSAAEKMSYSYTANILYGLVKAQGDMHKDSFCNVWKDVRSVFNNKTLYKEMNDKAVKIIYDYMVIYKDDCKK